MNWFEQLMRMDPPELAEEIQELASQDIDNLTIGENLVSTLAAETHATCFGVDEFEIDEDSIQVNPREIKCTARVSLSGDQDLEDPHSGTTIEGTLTIRLGNANCMGDSRDLRISLDDLDFRIVDS